MASAVNIGSINLPKMMRQISHRSSQVRDLTFIRDAVFDKEVATHRKKDSSQTALSGPAVSFGYESTTNQELTGWDGSTSNTANTAYHIVTPEIVLPGLTMLQSPIVSRSGRLERTGHRISGACTFYSPSLDYIKALDNFKDTIAFSELESFDKLYDMERIIHNPSDVSATQQTTTIDFADATSGYEVDRVSFKIKTAGTLLYVQLSAKIGGIAATLKWDDTHGVALSSSEFTTIDLPINKVEVGDTTSVYKDGTRTEFTAQLTGSFDVDKVYGDSNNELSSLIVQLSSSSAVELKDIYLYKEAEWRIESIKDYRDEYMQLGAVRVRGERTSRRRAYG